MRFKVGSQINQDESKAREFEKRDCEEGSIKREAIDEAYPRDDPFVQMGSLDKASMADCGISIGMKDPVGQSEVVRDAVW